MSNNDIKPIPMDPSAPDKHEDKDPAQLDYEAGVEFLKKGDLAQAASSFHNALVGFEQAGNKEGMANSTDKLGDVCKNRNEYDKALEYYDKAYEICKEFDDVYSSMSLNNKQAECLTAQEKYQEAINIYLDLLEGHEKMRNPDSSVKTLLIIADVYQKAGNMEGCIDAHKTAASIHANFGHVNAARRLQEKITELEKNL